MSLSFVMGQLRLALVALLAFAGGKGWLTPQDSTFALALASALGPLFVPWAWSIMSSLGKKMVPNESVAVSADNVLTAANPKGSTAILSDNASDKTVAVKVVGALLFAFILAGLMVPTGALAEPVRFNPDPLKIFAPKTAQASGVNVSAFQSALEKFNGGVQSITKEVVDTAIADVQAALDDATKKNDEISAPCWQAHLNLLKNLPVEWDAPPKMPIGIALGIQIQRDILNTINGTAKGTLKVDCAALYGDELKSIAGIGALLGIRIASGGIL